MAIQLTIINVNDSSCEYYRSFIQDSVIIGRSRTCDICLPHMSVSTRHLEIRLDKIDYKATDLGSLNGSFISNKKLIAYRAKTLRNNDVIEIGDYRLSFRLGVALGSAVSRNESTIQARRMLQSLLANSSSVEALPAIAVLGGPCKASRFELDPCPSIAGIGRAQDNKIRLEDTDVSRQHAKIEFADKKITVFNLGSRNGIIVNGKRVDHYELTQGQTFVVGNTTLGLEHPLDQCLLGIQDAPEEETSSFSPSTANPTLQTVPAKQEQSSIDLLENTPKESKLIDVQTSSSQTKLLVGPADPLNYPGQSGYYKTIKDLPIVKTETRNDLGLIVVGAIIVVACVFGLAWLCT